MTEGRKKITFILIAIALASVHFLPWTIVEAHSAAEENDVHIVLHIDPGDSPIINAPAVFHLYAMGLDKHLDEIGDCRVRIIATSSSQILFEHIFPHAEVVKDPNTLTASFVFPSKGMYPLILTCIGTTEADRIFTFHISVERMTSAMSFLELTNNWTHYLFHHSYHVLIFGGGLLIGIILTLRTKKTNSNNT